MVKLDYVVTKIESKTSMGYIALPWDAMPKLLEQLLLNILRNDLTKVVHFNGDHSALQSGRNSYWFVFVRKGLGVFYQVGQQMHKGFFVALDQSILFIQVILENNWAVVIYTTGSDRFFCKCWQIEHR